ncbi:hypothetical protein ACNJGF_21570, partial [Mycobacterium tuberculosis]
LSERQCRHDSLASDSGVVITGIMRAARIGPAARLSAFEVRRLDAGNANLLARSAPQGPSPSWTRTTSQVKEGMDIGIACT